MSFLAVRNLVLAVALGGLSPAAELPLDDWIRRVEELESLELVYTAQSEEGDFEVTILFEAPDTCYLRANGEMQMGVVDGMFWGHVPTEDSWATFAWDANEVAHASSEWLDSFRARLPRKVDSVPTEVRPSISLWPTDSGERMNIQIKYGAGSSRLFSWMEDSALESYSVAEVEEGLELTGEDGIRGLLDAGLGIPIKFWITDEGEEREVLSLERMAIDEGVEIPDPPQDATDASSEMNAGTWRIVRVIAYQWLWERTYAEDTALEESARGKVVESFREYYSLADADFFARYTEAYRDQIDERLTALQSHYDEVREDEGSVDRLDEEVRPTMEPELRAALINLRDSYHAQFVAPQIEDAEPAELEDFFELDIEGARAVFEEEFIEPMIDYLLDGLENVG